MLLQLGALISVRRMSFAVSNYEDILAPYASRPSMSRGRLHSEPEPDSRSCYQRDRDRIVHSTAFRRLEYKTQVFVNHEGDHYRTRLTHSLEVAQLTRSLCRRLHLNEDLGEALALAHDLGHTPFGHAGEDALREAMQGKGGFDHNAQAIRIVTHLEGRYAEFSGLNLTWETLEGMAKHNGPLATELSPVLKSYNDRHDLELATWPSLEAQIASLCDDIAYHNHDIEDGIRAGLFSLSDLKEQPLIGETLAVVDERYPAADGQQRLHETIRRVIHHMISDLHAETTARLLDMKAGSSDDIRAAGKPVAAFSAEIEAANRALKSFLMTSMYRHYRVNRMSSKARRLVAQLFEFFSREPECLPTTWQLRWNASSEADKSRVVSDFIAGMTDRFAIDEHRRIFDTDSK